MGVLSDSEVPPHIYVQYAKNKTARRENKIADQLAEGFRFSFVGALSCRAGRVPMAGSIQLPMMENLKRGGFTHG